MSTNIHGAISPRKAHLMLLAAAFFWGAGNVANKTVLHHLDPYTTVALRCLLAAVVVAPFVWAERADAQPHKPWIGSAIGIALIFAAALVFQQLAYQTTTVTNASFLVNTATIVTPLVAWVALGDKPGLRILVAGVVTLAGAFLMSGMSLSSATINSGDGACLIAALLFALWMVALGHHAVTHGRPFATSFVQFAVTALAMLPIIAVTQSPKLAAVNAA